MIRYDEAITQFDKNTQMWSWIDKSNINGIEERRVREARKMRERGEREGRG